MATKISRVFHKIFGNSGATSNFGQFGSEAASVGNKTKDISNIQGLSAWDNGWQDAVNASNKAPFLEDMNSCIYEHSYHLAYVLQEGIPEYDSNSFYFIGSIVKRTGTTEIYASLTDSNQGHALSAGADTAYWKYLGDLSALRPSILGRRHLTTASVGITTGVDAQIALDAEDFDLGGNFGAYEFIAPYSGYYRIEASVGYAATVDTKQYGINVYNSTAASILLQQASVSGGTAAIVLFTGGLVHLAQNDHIEIHTYQNSGITQYLTNDSSMTFMSVELIRKD
jgi:hypothetical protein